MLVVTTLFQTASLIGSVLILALCVYVARRWEDMGPLMVFPALWAASGVLLYVAIFAGWLTVEQSFFWGAIHRFLAVVMILGGVLALLAILTAPESPEYEPDSWDDDESE